MPRRRRGARAVAVDAEAERGLAMRILLHSPKDLVAGVLAFAAASAIIANALFLQAGHHPSPMFGSVVAMPAAGLAPASPLPRPRPVELATKPAETSLPEFKPAEFRPAESRPVEIKPAEPKAVEPRAVQPKAADPLANLVKATAVMPVTGQCSAATRTNSSRGPGLAPCGGGAARAHGIWLRPVEADRDDRFGHPGRDPEVRAGAQAAGDRADVRSPGARPFRHDRTFDRLACFRAKACPALDAWWTPVRVKRTRQNII